MSNIRKQTARWTTKGGAKVRICDMTDQHLLNCINLLRRRKPEILANAYLSMQLMRDEVAIEEMRRKVGSLEASDIEEFAVGRQLLLDARRRGLDVQESS